MNIRDAIILLFIIIVGGAGILSALLQIRKYEGDYMQQVEGSKMTLEDRQYLENEIKELELKIKEVTEKQNCTDSTTCAGLVSPDVVRWNKELRHLRRLRNVR